MVEQIKQLADAAQAGLAHGLVANYAEGLELEPAEPPEGEQEAEVWGHAFAIGADLARNYRGTYSVQVPAR